MIASDIENVLHSTSPYDSSNERRSNCNVPNSNHIQLQPSPCAGLALGPGPALAQPATSESIRMVGSYLPYKTLFPFPVVYILFPTYPILRFGYGQRFDGYGGHGGCGSTYPDFGTACKPRHS